VAWLLSLEPLKVEYQGLNIKTRSVANHLPTLLINQYPAKGSNSSVSFSGVRD
jgi:hypothetical protein